MKDQPGIVTQIGRWKRWRWWIIGAVVVVLCGTVVAPYVFLHIIEPPPPAPLSLSATNAHTPSSSTPASASSSPTAPHAISTAPASAPATTTLSGTWSIGNGSTAEYRVSETLFGQSTIAVGSTSTISGSMTLTGLTVMAASFTVPLQTVQSNESQRDFQFDTRIMDVAQYPNAVFTLTSPITLSAIPPVNTIITVEATGTLAMHGVSRSVTFPMKAEYTGATIKVNGSIPITFANWNIQNPSGGPAQVGNAGTLEFLITLDR